MASVRMGESANSEESHRLGCEWCWDGWRIHCVLLTDTLTASGRKFWATTDGPTSPTGTLPVPPLSRLHMNDPMCVMKVTKNIWELFNLILLFFPSSSHHLSLLSFWHDKVSRNATYMVRIIFQLLTEMWVG